MGYDTRFGSPRFARIAAEVLASAGIPIKLANDYSPTPAISLAVKQLGAAGGVVITSSHNPWNWNGVKFKGRFGGSATPEIIKGIETELLAGTSPNGQQGSPLKKWTSSTPTWMPSASSPISSLIAKAGFKFAVDSMYGSGRGVLAKIFADHGIAHVAIRQELNPLFPGINPEPIEPHVAMLQQTVVKEGCHAGFASDGDADRIGAVAEDGSFVDAHKIFSVLLRWLLVRKKWPGDVVRAFNTTRMLDRIAARYGRKLLRVRHRLQVHRRPDDGTRHSDWRRRIRRDRLFAISARARRHPERLAARQCHGGRRQATRPTGGRSATGVRSSLLRPARPAHSGERETSGHSASSVPIKPRAWAAIQS